MASFRCRGDAYNLFWRLSEPFLASLQLRIWYWQIPLMTGSTCVVWPNWQSQDISQLMQYFRRHRRNRSFERLNHAKSLAESHFKGLEVASKHPKV